MALHMRPQTLTADQIAAWERDGCLVVPRLLNPVEIDELTTAFAVLHEEARRNGGSIPGCFTIGTPEEIAADPLKLYPRMMHPHRVDPVAMRYLLDPRIGAILTDLFGEEPLAAQSMFYWKPPGARGQALHQDNFYLRVKPGTCIAAWIPLDECDEENGALAVVPGTQGMEIVCPEDADPSTSFTKHLVRPPAGYNVQIIRMSPGDCLFFNGSVIHGSEPNRSPTRFRRSFICHYVGVSAEELARFYKPLYTFGGQPIADIPEATGGGPCGVEAKGPH